MATLVHDDVVDDALLRRGRPTVFAQRRPRDGDRDGRLPVLARLRAARRERRRRAGAGALGRMPRARARRARAAPRCLPARRRRGALPAALRAEDRAACSRPPAGWARSRPAGRPREAAALESYGTPARPRVPDARRRARRERPGGAHRQAPRHRPARRHRHPAADPRATLDPSCARSTCARSRSREEAEALCDRIAATGALDETRARAAALVAEAKDALRGDVDAPLETLAARRRGPHRRALRVTRSRQI